MGQYYHIVNLTKKEIIRPQDAEYNKLIEFAYTDTPSIEQLWLNLSDRWKNNIVFLCGDYYDSTGAPEYNPYAAELERICDVNPGELYKYTQNNFKEVFVDLADKPKIPKYAVNPVTKTCQLPTT